MKLTSQKLIAGDKWSWIESITDYPSLTHSLEIIIQKAAAAPITISSSANADNVRHNVLKPASETGSIASGNYVFYARVTNKSDAEDVTTILRGTIPILPNLSSGTDGRSQWHRIFENLMAKYEEMTENGHVYTETTIDGRTKKLDRAALITEIRRAAGYANIDVSGISFLNRKPTKILSSRGYFK